MADYEAILSVNRRPIRVYHTYENCIHAPNETRRITVEEAEKMGLHECAMCSGEWSNQCGGGGHYQSLLKAAEARQEGSADV